MKIRSFLIAGCMAAVLPAAVLVAQTKPGKASTVRARTKPAVAKEKSVPAEQPFRMTVAAKGYPDSTLVNLYLMTNRQYVGPQGIVKKEQVVLTGNLPQTDGYALVFTTPGAEPAQQGFYLFLNNGVYQLQVNRQEEEIKLVSGDRQSTALSDLMRSLRPRFEELNKLAALQQQYQAAGKPTDSLAQRQGQELAAVNKAIPAFIVQQPASPVAAFVLKITQSAMAPEQLERNLALLQGEAAADADIQQIKQQLTAGKMFAEGQPAPDFTQADTLGKPVSLSSFKGKYVLIDFWASWCRPCRMENPNVVNVYKQYKDKNFTVLGVSLDNDRGKWLQAIKDDGLTWTHVSDLQYWQNAVAQQYQIGSIPQNLLIGPDGKIIAKNLRGGVLDAYLKDLLK